MKGEQKTRLVPNQIIKGLTPFERFRARLLALLLKREIITQELIDLLMSWYHNSDFQRPTITPRNLLKNQLNPKLALHIHFQMVRFLQFLIFLQIQVQLLESVLSSGQWHRVEMNGLRRPAKTS